MERSLSVQLHEKDEPPPPPDNNRSTKKVKIREDAEDFAAMVTDDNTSPNDNTFIEMLPSPDINPEMGFDHRKNEAIPSFKDKLLNSDKMQNDGEKQDEDDDSLTIDTEDFNISKDGPIPLITFSQRVHQILNDSMRLAVVVKMLGRQIRHRDLKDRLTHLWKPTSPFKISDIEGDCFIARFSNSKDYEAALLNGPWVISGHYVTVHPWSPDFSPQNHTVSQVVGWIRLPGLPTKYYKKNVIRAIGEVLGEVVRIDYNTEFGDREKFARMAIVIDLSKPLTSKINVDGKTLLIEYEGLPTICFHCGHYGHLECSCPEKSSRNVAESSSSTSPSETVVRESQTKEASEKELYGPWMQVQRRGRRYDRGPKRTSNDSFHSSDNRGSRFDLLAQTVDTIPNDVKEPYNSNVNVRNHHFSDSSTLKVSKSMQASSNKLKRGSQPRQSQQRNFVVYPSDSIFESNAYKAHASPSFLDSSSHSVVTVPNPRMALKSIDEPRQEPPIGPEVKLAHHQPKPPDRLHSDIGLRIPTSLTIKNLKHKSREPAPSLSDEALKQLAKSLGHQDTDVDDEAYASISDGDEGSDRSNMES